MDCDDFSSIASRSYCENQVSECYLAACCRCVWRAYPSLFSLTEQFIHIHAHRKGRSRDNAKTCGRSMNAFLSQLNATRREAGETSIITSLEGLQKLLLKPAYTTLFMDFYREASDGSVGASSYLEARGNSPSALTLLLRLVGLRMKANATGFETGEASLLSAARLEEGDDESEVEAGSESGSEQDDDENDDDNESDDDPKRQSSDRMERASCFEWGNLLSDELQAKLIASLR